MTKLISRRLVAGGLALAVTGCATIVRGDKQKVMLNSEPSGAKVVILDEMGNEVMTETTPAEVNLTKKKNYFEGKDYTIQVSMDGYETREIPLERKVSLWYIAGNIAFGGLIGWVVVDPLSGAMWTYEPEEINQDFGKAVTGDDQSLTLNIVMLEEAPANVRTLMKPVG